MASFRDLWVPTLDLPRPIYIDADAGLLQTLDEAGLRITPYITGVEEGDEKILYRLAKTFIGRGAPRLAIDIAEELVRRKGIEESIWIRAQVAFQAGLYRKRIGDCLRKLGKYREAIAAYREVEASYSWLRLPIEILLRLPIEIGDIYFLMGEEDAAVSEFARTLSPQDLPTKRAVNLANLLSSKGMSEKALEILAAADRQYPGDPELLYTRGEIRLAARDLDGAEEDFQSVLKLAPDNGSALYNLARIDLLREDPAAALGHLRQARDRNEKSLKEILAQDPFFRQTAPGDSSLATFVKQMLGEGADE